MKEKNITTTRIIKARRYFACMLGDKRAFLFMSVQKFGKY